MQPVLLPLRTLLPAIHGPPAAHPLLLMHPCLPGDYGVWEGEAHQLVDRWAPGFAQAGCQLSLQSR